MSWASRTASRMRPDRNLLRLGTGLYVVKRTQVDTAQQAARLQVVAVALQDVLGFEDCIANAAGLGVQFGESGVQVIRGRIVLDRQPILINRLDRKSHTSELQSLR